MSLDIHSLSKSNPISYFESESHRRYSRGSLGLTENVVEIGSSLEKGESKSLWDMSQRTSPSEGALPKSTLTSGQLRADSRSGNEILPDAIPENADAILLTWFHMNDLARMENPISLPSSEVHGMQRSTVRIGSVSDSNLERFVKSCCPSNNEQASEIAPFSHSDGHSSIVSKR